MLIRNSHQGFDHPLSSEITPQAQYLQRRAFMQTLAMGAAGATLAGWAGRDALAAADRVHLPALKGVASKVAGAMTMDAMTSYQDVTGYNNYYEFGLDKDEPARNAHTLKTRP